jgi:hypothetical protein
MKPIHVWLPVVIVTSFVGGTLVPSGKAQQKSPKPPKYIEMSFMKTDGAREADYVKLEQEQWKPLHQERIKQGKIRSWYFFGVRSPSGSEVKYNFVTVNTYDQFGQMENPYADLDQVIKKVHPGVNMDDFFNRTTKSRDIVRNEVWELIDQAE